MPQSQQNKDFRFEKPAAYRIRVKGHLDESWSGQLGGMTITITLSANKAPVTILEGYVQNQAALSSLLNTLYDLHLLLLAVECLDEKMFDAGGSENNGKSEKRK